jgi:hypothetical protein
MVWCGVRVGFKCECEDEDEVGRVVRNDTFNADFTRFLYLTDRGCALQSFSKLNDVLNNDMINRLLLFC